MVAKVEFSVPGEELDYFLINGPSMKEVLDALHGSHRKTGASGTVDVRSVAVHFVYDEL